MAHVGSLRLRLLGHVLEHGRESVCGIVTDCSVKSTDGQRSQSGTPQKSKHEEGGLK